AERIAALAGRIELVVVTHRHPDHTDGIDHLRDLVAAPVRAPLEEFCRDATELDDDEVIHAAGLGIRVLATPGHTADSVSFEVRIACRGPDTTPDCVVLGDTILGRDSTVLDSTDGDLGDYLTSMDRLAASPGGWVLGDTRLRRASTVLDPTDGDLGDGLPSVGRLAARAEGVTGVPGHGADVEDTGRFARELGRHRRDRLEQIIAARAELG